MLRARGFDRLTRIARRLPALYDRLDPRGLVDDLLAVQLSRIQRRFLQGVDTDGTPWPISNDARIRASGGFTRSNGQLVTGGSTLFATGRLFRSIQAAHLNDSAGEIFTDVPYATFHQEGTTRLPQREFLGISTEDEAVHVQVINAHLRRVLPNAIRN